MVMDYLIVDEGVVVVDALLIEDAFVVGEEVEVEVLHGLDVFEDDRPVVVEVRLQFQSVPQVHAIINYISPGLKQTPLTVFTPTSTSSYHHQTIYCPKSPNPRILTNIFAIIMRRTDS